MKCGLARSARCARPQYGLSATSKQSAPSGYTSSPSSRRCFRSCFQTTTTAPMIYLRPLTLLSPAILTPFGLRQRVPMLHVQVAYKSTNKQGKGENSKQAEISNLKDHSSKQKDKRRDGGAAGTDPLSEFFARYPGFTYDPNNSPSFELQRMFKQFGWHGRVKTPDAERPEHPKRREARNLFKTAITRQFNKKFGHDVGDPKNWGRLCFVLGIHPVPKGLRACQKAVRGVHVNIEDLVNLDLTKYTDALDAHAVELPPVRPNIRLFDTRDALSRYSWRQDKIFPADEAHAGGVLRYLLRHLRVL
ncbi:hypothetical protein FA95DRAFT_916306 [Auriscalpium vulgare]|uniref:Uncharacterized protein n=1 Tax=Auriscalpium vulgare TaxID=40419 RepID=A0ACB8R7P0_9AGAM|nr:hypothetical protein FA95DRAFT_916306 [Auriscalpium vulgare]